MNRAARFPSLLAALACAASVDAAKPAPPLLSYQLDSSDFAVLESPAKLSETLGKLVGQEFPDTTKLLEAIRDAFPNAPAIPRSLASIVRTGFDLPSNPHSDSACEYMDIPCPVQTIWLDSVAARRLRNRFVQRHHLPDFPSPLLEAMKTQAGLGYPEEELLHLALIARIADGLGVCPANLPGNAEKTKALRMSEEEFQSAQRLLVPPLPPGAAPTDPLPSLMQLIANYRSRRVPCTLAERDAVHGLVRQIYDSLLRPAAHELAPKQHPARPFRPPLWTGKGCGCSLRGFNGQVYGFYPRWSFDSTVHTVDFGLVQRIEFHALSFDKVGAFDDPSDIDSARFFLDEARKHDVRVDWVVTRSDWRGWTEEPAEDRQEMFQNLSNHVASLLTRRMDGLWDRIRRGIPLFPNSTNFTWGDGVTLHLPGYPSDTLSVRLFRDFYRALVLRLQATGLHLQVNLLFGHPDLEKPDGIFAYAPLVGLLDFTDSLQTPAGADSVPPPRRIETRFLLLLDAPTLWTKKQMQREIDFRLHSVSRQKFLRALVPVLMHPGTDLRQTEADITYFNDTYYGMGFWPLPHVTTPDDPENPHDKLSEIVRTRFSENDSIVEEPSAFATQVCKHRWELRLLLFASLFLLAAAVAASFLTCWARRHLETHRVQAGLVLLGGPIALFTILLFNDPDLTAVKTGNTPYGMMTALFAATLAGIGTYLHYRTPKPNRTTLKQAMEKLRGGGRK